MKILQVLKNVLSQYTLIIGLLVLVIFLLGFKYLLVLVKENALKMATSNLQGMSSNKQSNEVEVMRSASIRTETRKQKMHRNGTYLEKKMKKEF